MKENEKQVGGTHYKKQAIQTWDFVYQNDIGYLEGNAIKYIARWRDKGGIQDLQKAKHYIDKIIELEEKSVLSKQVEEKLAAMKAGQAECMTAEQMSVHRMGCVMMHGSLHDEQEDAYVIDPRIRG